MRIYEIPKDEDFYDYWADDAYDVAILDEFKGQKKIQWLNAWLDGSPCTLRQKGAQYVKFYNVPTIIISNFSPHEVYKNSDERKLAPLLDRLEVIEIQEEILIDYVEEEEERTILQ